MVMEASPSPQCVGREFVRQYYTLLNKAPNHVHRFYNTTSSFVHGGLDTTNKETKPAIGQKQIHQKIQQLNFRDCHAKITQVDSQATLGNGVVVQVSGELSNAGQPMRRFTQTFVLGAQAPKNYYVHNDIFRYQDFGFPDEEEVDSEGPDSGMHDSGDREIEEGGRSEPEEDEQQNQVEQISAPITATEQITTVVMTAQPPISGQPLYYPPLPQQHVHSVMPPVINGSVHEDASLIGQQPLQQTIPPPQQPAQPQQQPQYVSEPVVQEQFTQETDVNTSNDQQPIKEEAHSTPNESHEQVEAENFSTPATDVGQEHSVSAPTSTSNSGPKTYANLVKSFPCSQGMTNPQPPKISMSPPPITNLRLEERSPSHPPSTAPSFSSNTNVSVTQQPPHRVPGNQQPPPPQQQQPQQQRPPRSGPMQRDGERRSGRPNQFTDAHQLFLGNVPHHATESDLRQLFERYGRVAELRVHSKQSDRSSTTRVPNYGFITFEDSQVVAKVLNDLPIYYPDENGQIKLNVEEKKMKSRMSMEGVGGRSSTGGDNMRSMGGQQQQQQQRGPGGPGGMRGGGSRGGPRNYPRSGGEGGRGSGGGGGMRQPGNPSNQNYANRR